MSLFFRRSHLILFDLPHELNRKVAESFSLLFGFRLFSAFHFIPSFV